MTVSILGPVHEYWLDAWQRSILLLDTLRQRGNRYLEQSKKEAPHVLEFESELIRDGRTMPRPTNYLLVRIVPPEVSRIDPTVNFSWGSGSPASAIGADTFSARWTGQIEAPYSGAYRFFTVSDDGVRLWVNGVQRVNHWNNHSAFEDSGTISLTAGQRYSIRMEYYENTGSATARQSSATSALRAVWARARKPAPGA